ncbi:MAG: hypothetical protein H6625_08205 [Bdellovibrionaceae bacterium]|nr:hypothetical protein [Pseudobdellovibrionaceae bacterium]
MNDSKRHLLLMGHSKNLKFKLLLLRSYLLNSTPQTDSEIINQIHEIHWTHCETFESSQQLAKKLKEEFRSAYTIDASDKDTFYYLKFRPSKHTLLFSLELEADNDKFVFGAFRGKHHTFSVYTALLRWIRFYYLGGSVMQWPSPFNKQYMPQKWSIKRACDSNLTPHLDEQIVEFLSGQSRQLLLSFTEKLELDRENLDKFTRLWLHRDLSRLDRFFRHSVLRNKKVIHCLGVNSNFIEPEWASPLRIRPSI